MNRTRWMRWLAVLSVVALVAAACGDDDTADPADPVDPTDPTDPVEPSEDDILFGTLFPESGDLSPIVDSLRVPVDLAVEEINEAGGILGRNVAVVGADDGTDDLSLASASFERLVESDGVHVILGPAASTLTEGLMDSIAASDVIIANGSNTGAAIEDLDDNGRYFGFAPNDNLQGPALAEVVNADEHDTVAILVRDDTYGVGFGNAIEAALADIGVDVVSNERYDPEADSYTAEVQRVIDAEADAVVVIGFSGDGGAVIQAMIDEGVGPGDFPIYTGDGMQGSSFWEAVGAEPSLVEGIKGTAPAAAPEGVEHPFQARFAETGVDTIFSAYYYDAAITTALAIQAAGTTDADAVSAAMLEVTNGDTPCTGFAECKELLEAGESINVQGASGALELNENGHVTSGAYDVWEYNDAGEPVTLDEPQIRIEL